MEVVTMHEIRPFTRSDRDQLAELVNVHIAAVLPGSALPVSALLAQFEREPAQYVVDPWVIDRVTLVAIERDRVLPGPTSSGTAPTRASCPTTTTRGRSPGSSRGPGR
jgi:hypothetical protein